MKNFIIAGHLVEPPTSPSSFRDLTFWIHYDYRNIENILIEEEKENWDKIWRFLKFYKNHDFIYDFVKPADHEIGLRLDDTPKFAPTIQAPYINEKNVYNILRAVSYNI